MVSWACLWLTPVAKDCPCSLFDSQCEQSLFVNPDVLKDCLSPWASFSPIMIHLEVDPLDSRTTSPSYPSQPTSLFEELPEESSVLKNLRFWLGLMTFGGEGNGTPLQYSCLETPMDGGAWKAAVHGVAEGQTRLSTFTFTFHFYALEKEMAMHSSVLAWRIPGAGEPGGLPSMGSHRVGHDWSDLAAAAVFGSHVRDCLPHLTWEILYKG